MQLKPLTLRRNFSWTFAGNVVYAACQWGMLVVLAKLGSPEMVGQFTLGLAVTAPVIMLANLQLRAVQVTDARQQYVFGDYLGLRLITTMLAFLAIAVITFAAGYRWQTSLVILAIGFAKAVESISDIFYALLQQQERMNRIAVSMMLKGPLSLLLLSIGVYLTHSVFWGVVGLAVAWALVLCAYDIQSGVLILNTSLKTLPGEVTLRPRWHLGTLKLVWLALPLGWVMMLVSLNTSIPRYFIEQYLGERELGVFAAIAYLMVSGNIVVSALADAAGPRLAKYYAAQDKQAFCTLLLNLSKISVLLGVIGIVASVVAGREILTLLYQPEYAERVDVFVWLMVVAGISYLCSCLNCGMISARYFWIQIPLFALVTSISAIACWWLIPIKGLQGAAIAIMIAAIVQAGMSLGVVVYALYKLPRLAPRK